MAQLLENERMVSDCSFGTSLIWFPVKADMRLTTQRLLADAPEYMLGLIPFDRRSFESPISRLSRVYYQVRFLPATLGLGALFVLTHLSDSLISFIMVPLGILILLSSVRPTIVVVDHTGRELAFPVTLLQCEEAREFVAVVTRSLGHAP